MFTALLVATSLGGVLQSPNPIRYRIDFVASDHEAWSVVGTDDRSLDLTAAIWITITMRDTVDGSMARILIDSATVNPTGTAKAPVFGKPLTESRGVSFDVRVVNGKLDVNSNTPEGSELVDVVASALLLIFPGRRDPRSGARWADTMKVDKSDSTWVTTGQNVTQWGVVYVGGDSTVLNATMRGTLMRTRVVERVSASSDMASTRTLTLDARGALRNGNFQFITESIVTIPQFPAPVPVKRTTTMTVTALPTPRP